MCMVHVFCWAIWAVHTAIFIHGILDIRHISHLDDFKIECSQLLNYNYNKVMFIVIRLDFHLLCEEKVVFLRPH